MINICLCDDNQETRRDYAQLIEEIAQRNQIPLQLFTYKSGEQLLLEAEDQIRGYDIVYMDMLMGKLNGIQTAKTLRDLGFDGKIIFLTSSRDHALDAFDVTPLHYILKQETPPQRFEEILLKATALVRDLQKEWFVFENKSKQTRVLLEDIQYFEVIKRQVSLHTPGEVFCFYSQIDAVERQLAEKYFVRCHRSFVVNLKYIRSLSPTELLLSGGVSIPVGSTYLKDVKYRFSGFLERKSVLI